MTDEAFQTRQRGKYATALANLMPGTRDAGLVTVTLYGRQAGMTPDEYKEHYGFKKGTPLAAKSLVRMRKEKMESMCLWERRKTREKSFE